MPISQSQIKKKDRKDLLLELIEKQYGPSNAIVMEKAFKTQDKQIEQAMLEGGATADQVGSTKGIDLRQLDALIKNKGQDNSNKVQQSTMPQLLPSKGIMSPAQQTPEGNIQEGGALSWIGGHSTSDLLKKLTVLSKIQQAPMEMNREARLQRQEKRLLEQLDISKSAEGRRREQFQVRNLQYFGASVTPEMLEDNPTLNSVVTPLIKKFGITPEVNPETNEITFEIPMQAELEQKALISGKIEEKELASMAEKLPNLDRAEDAINQLKKSFNNAWQPKSIDEGEFVEGIFERLRGTSSIPLESWTQTNPELHTYLSNVGAFSSLISKGGFLEAGVLTNQDIQRVIQALPKPGYSKERVALAWETIDGVIGSARKRFEEKKKEYSGRGGKQKPSGKTGFDFSGKSTEELQKRLQELKGVK